MALNPALGGPGSVVSSPAQQCSLWGKALQLPLTLGHSETKKRIRKQAICRSRMVYGHLGDKPSGRQLTGRHALVIWATRVGSIRRQCRSYSYNYIAHHLNLYEKNKWKFMTDSELTLSAVLFLNTRSPITRSLKKPNTCGLIVAALLGNAVQRFWFGQALLPEYQESRHLFTHSWPKWSDVWCLVLWYSFSTVDV